MPSPYSPPRSAIPDSSSGRSRFPGGMRAKRVVVLAVLAVWSVASIPLALRIWPSQGGLPVLPIPVLAAFLTVWLAEGAAFALGLAFLVRGAQLLRGARQPRPLTHAAHISIAWLLVNWWPHDNIHRMTGLSNLAVVAEVDVAFHLTLIIAGCIAAAFFVAVLRSQQIKDRHRSMASSAQLERA